MLASWLGVVALAQDARDVDPGTYVDMPLAVHHREGEVIWDPRRPPVATRPDLVSDGPYKGWCSNGWMSITARWWNDGPAVEHWVDMYVSRNPGPVLGDYGDYAVYVLSPADSYNEYTFVLPIPEDWGVEDGVGNRRVDVIVDTMNFVSEPDETNNTFSWIFQYWWGAACD